MMNTTTLARFPLLLIAVLALAGCGDLKADAGPAPLNQTYGFRVAIDGVESPDVWLSVDGMGFAVGTAEAADPALGGFTSSPTGPSPITLTFELAFDPAVTPDIEQWVRDTYKGADVRKSITVTVIAPDGTKARTFDFFECFPTRYQLVGAGSGSREAVHWTLEVRVNRIDMA